MFVSHIKEIKGKRLEGETMKGVLKKVLISPKEGWKDYVMRLFSLEKGGYTPKHSHPWEHINIVLEGKGTLNINGKEFEVEKGSIAFVPPEIEHQFRADKGESFEFICIVPLKGETQYNLK